MGRRLRAISPHDPPPHRGGEGRGARADRADRASCCEQSVKEARRLAATARRKARGRGAQAKLRAAAKLDELADRCEKVAKQITQRVRGEKITDRLDLARRSRRQADPQGQARQAQRVRLRRADRRDHPEHQARRARTDRAGGVAARQPRRERAAARDRRPSSSGSGSRPRRSRWTAASPSARRPSNSKTSTPERVFISGRQQPGSRRTQRRLQRYRTGAEGRISHLKRGYGMRPQPAQGR